MLLRNDTTNRSINRYWKNTSLSQVRENGSMMVWVESSIQKDTLGGSKMESRYSRHTFSINQTLGVAKTAHSIATAATYEEDAEVIAKGACVNRRTRMLCFS